jgi:two-component system sensor histidine kinase/response regulator
VDVAGNGQKAIDKLFTGPIPPPYDVVLMDLQMPVLDGHQATAKIRADQRFASLPIFAMTAHATLEERDFCLANGMSAHIAKPIDPALLFDTLSKVARPAPAATATARAAESAAAPADVVPSDVPSIDGLDRADGLRRVGGNRKLYVTLLREFASQQAETVGGIRAALAADDGETATRLAHTLKGVAGNLGAVPVQKAAAAIEIALRDGSGADRIEAALGQLAAVLDPLMAQLRDTFVGGDTGGAAPTASAPAVSPAQTRAVAEQLAKLFGDFDTSAVTFTEQNEAALRPAFDAASWERFLRHTQEFAFAEARTLLDGALARLSQS